MKLDDRVAVITGAGGGIGRAIGLALARRGCHLALADIDDAGNAETAALAGALGVKTSCHRLDVASADAVAALPFDVMQAHGRVDVLVNNAGVAVGGAFVDVSAADFDWLMDINFHGLVRMTRAFLPLLQQSDRARIVNMSSLFGLISPPGQSAYCASKFAVRGFSNALRHELTGTNVGMTVAHPGGVASSIAKNARMPGNLTPEKIEQSKAIAEKLLRMAPDKAGAIIVRAIEKERSRVIVGVDALVLSWLERLVPVHYWRVLDPCNRLKWK
jgi:NAD(P)-dependent dehydrogenase (short-subunit alcohol dehydrogenase family)